MGEGGAKIQFLKGSTVPVHGYSTTIPSSKNANIPNLLGTCEIVKFLCVEVGRDGPAHPLDAEGGVEQLQHMVLPQKLNHFPL